MADPDKALIGLNNMEEYSKDIMRCVAGCTKLSNNIPSDSDYSLYSSYPAFKQIVSQHAAKCQKLMGLLSRKMQLRCKLSGTVEEQMDWLVDTNDQLLEQISTELDVMSGVRRSAETVMCSVNTAVRLPTTCERWNVSTNRTEVTPSSGRPVRLLAAENVERPQLRFRRVVDNSSAPFVPLITDKPNALKPLAVLLEKDGEEERYSHPYEFELLRFTPADCFLTPPATDKYTLSTTSEYSSTTTTTSQNSSTTTTSQNSNTPTTTSQNSSTTTTSQNSSATRTTSQNSSATTTSQNSSATRTTSQNSSATTTSQNSSATTTSSQNSDTPAKQLPSSPSVSSSLSSTAEIDDKSAPVTIVDTEAGLSQLASDLSKVNELAVDLEHHSYRSYLGLTCLMQISTRHRDYIVDTLALRDRLSSLNSVLTDPAVVKVFHGADMDVLWLQRDCGLYVVHMFDTHQASRVLQLPRLSLAYLLQHFCGIQPDKRLQLADWRIRPLPEEMVRYAQQDTHHLLYIYDRLREMLVKNGNEQNNLMHSVYSASTNVCLKRYDKPRLTDESHKELYNRSRKTFNFRQMTALKQIHQWRDTIARDMDESTHYVLPNHMLLHMVEVLPREMQGLLACCSPVPPLVRQHLHTLHQIVLAARKLPLSNTSGVSASDTTTVSPSVLRRRNYDPDSLLNCVHDLGHIDSHRLGKVTTLLSDFTPDVSCVNSATNRQSSVGQHSSFPLKQRPQLEFGHFVQYREDKIGVDWISPHQRYIMLANDEVDEKGQKYMQELSDSTSQLNQTDRSISHALPEQPEQSEESGDSDRVEEKTEREWADMSSEIDQKPDIAKEASMPKSLRFSKADKLREMKNNNKAGKKRKRGAKSNSNKLARREPAGGVREEDAGGSEPAPFNYDQINYGKLLGNAQKKFLGKRAKTEDQLHRRPAACKRARRAGKVQVFGPNSKA